MNIQAAVLFCACLWLGFTVLMHWGVRRDGNLASTVLLTIYYIIGAGLVVLAGTGVGVTL